MTAAPGPLTVPTRLSRRSGSPHGWMPHSPALRFPRRAGWLILLCLLAGCERSAGPYPSKEIKLIVQASPGGISDTVSRFMGALAEERLGVPVVCENRPGASGALAFSYVVRQVPDGYTLGHGPVEISMVRALGYADVGPAQMDLICLVSKIPAVLVVQKDAPWTTLKDFLDEARVRRGEIIMANSGTGSIWHVNTLLLEQQTGVRVTHVPYSGSSGSLAALLGGHVDAVVAGAGEVVAHVEAGRLRVLAVLGPERSPLFPAVPSVHEDGYPFGVAAWSGFYAPKGVPEDILTRIESAFRDASERPEWGKLCEDRGMEPAFLGRDEFRRFATEQAAFFGGEIPKLLRLER